MRRALSEGAPGGWGPSSAPGARVSRPGSEDGPSHPDHPDGAQGRVGGWRGTACAGVRRPLRETGCVLFPPPPSELIVTVSVSISSPVGDIHSVQVVVHLAPSGLSNIAQPVSLR